jgi:hypothetical protein
MTHETRYAEGEPVRGATEVSFIRPRPAEETQLVTFNAPKSLDEYLKKAGAYRPPGAKKPRGKTDVIIRAIAFDRDLGEKTKHITERLEAFAAAHGLTLEDDAAEVVAQLMERGVKDWEREHTGRKTSR